jgi:hypothetical protein
LRIGRNLSHIHEIGFGSRARAKGKPAIEASFGYGYTDYVIDKDPNNYDPSYENRGVIDLQHPEGT